MTTQILSFGIEILSWIKEDFIIIILLFLIYVFVSETPLLYCHCFYFP